MGTSRVSGKKPELDLMILRRSGCVQAPRTHFIEDYGQSSSYKTTHHDLGIPSVKTLKCDLRTSCLTYPTPPTN
jgi:hypothetical protein